MSTSLHGGKPANQGTQTADAPDAGETISSADVASDGRGTTAGTHVKVCCVCGTDVANERRYKDAEGHYWCCECAKTDSGRKHPATCPDCKQAVPSNELVQFEGKAICPACHTKHLAAAKRAAARLAAAVEETKLQTARYRRMVIMAGVAAGLLVIFAVIRILVH